ncbi:MAG: bifunctional phosphopantothenoylcysteine decarboxylase/phosphopantothenate--cysteine ligase CoaBC [Bacteroidetes bacterium HGW-Bacteroidetes-17]|jgi:phosphopantothenoylcysteine decarboxylase/phosphopantothenate--cysteine ligase|nr:MAG: bifunctional phosphopantothenoylcysteine decarboxylase/phosphopantothenate--cysteine ligase CoaBC [Bacteroidetes bacterium HGW-Bacteroidetes-17]
MLTGKNILIGVTGGIAAYKIPSLVRLLKKAGAEVQIVMSPMSKEFVTPLTLSTVSGRPVLSEFFHKETGEWNSHVELGMWADVFLIAPATASSMGKMVNGIADNLLITTYLSAKCPVIFAPAMDLDMYKHPSTTKNVSELVARGHILLEPNHGELASGLCGEGRMQEPDQIMKVIVDQLKKKADLEGKSVLISAGPTYESIDPVRFIGNHSTGLMGYEIAEECANRGAIVTLVSGPSNLQVSHPNIKKIDVISADEMFNACIAAFSISNIAIMAAAVADFKPKNVSSIKIKKSEAFNTIDLIPTKDILAKLGELKKNEQFLIGFALETNNEIENAKNKLKNKNLDFIVLNSLQNKEAGFGKKTNQVTIIDKAFNQINYQVKTKKEVAADIVNKIKELIK